MKKIYPVILACALLLAACNDDDNPRQDALNENRGKWEASNLTSYVFQFSRVCFCIPESPIVVTVTDGVVTGGFFTPSGEILEPERLATVRTLDGYFDLIQDAIEQDAYKLNVTYDATYGFPTEIFIDYGELLVDDEISHYISDFQ